MDTFVESYDFTGKTIVPFCTSGSSGVGDSDDNLKENAGIGNWLEGTRFGGGVSETEIRNWIDSLELGGQEETMAGNKRYIFFIQEKMLNIIWSGILEDNKLITIFLSEHHRLGNPESPEFLKYESDKERKTKNVGLLNHHSVR